MATATSISLSEYLQHTYEPDCDYIDGELKKRNVGEQPHGRIQAIIASIFEHPSDGIFAVPGTPIRIFLPELFAELDEVC